MAESVPEQSFRRRLIVSWMYDRHLQGVQLMDISDVCGALNLMRVIVRSDFEVLRSLGTLRLPGGDHIDGEILLAEAGIADCQRGLYEDDFEIDDEGLCVVILKLLRRARATPKMNNEAAGQFIVRGGPFRALGLRYEDVFDYLDVLGDLGAISLHRFISEVDIIRLLSPGVSAAMTGSLDTLQRRGGQMESGIHIGTINAPAGVVGVGRDNFTQRVTMNNGSAELRQLVDELKAALVERATDDDDREDREKAVKRVGRQLASTEPDMQLGRRAWEAVVAFATVEGTIQGLDRIGKALVPFVPMISAWYGGAPPLPPGIIV